MYGEHMFDGDQGFGVDHMFGTDWSWLWAGSMMLFWVAVLAVAVWAIVRLTRANAGGGQGPTAQSGSGPTPEAILDRRLASGEITTAEHRELLDELQHRAKV